MDHTKILVTIFSVLFVLGSLYFTLKFAPLFSLIKQHESQRSLLNELHLARRRDRERFELTKGANNPS